ncbi:Uncharacterised protein [Mycobacteroides abscessus subsp. massiliense]|nr:Uncharacterised protein [Mycobacteroides abscessus subsp. massiliense]
MIQGDSAVLILVPSLGKPTMPPHEVGPAPVQEGLRDTPRAPPPPPCVIKDALHGNRVHGWLGNPRGLISRRRIGRQLRGLPARGTREISVDPVREDNVRDHPVGPLRRKQGVQLGDGAFDAQRRQPNRHECRVPAPHVRVQLGSGTGHGSPVIAPEQVRRARCQLRRSKHRVGRHPSIVRRA